MVVLLATSLLKNIINLTDSLTILTTMIEDILISQVNILAKGIILIMGIKITEDLTIILEVRQKNIDPIGEEKEVFASKQSVPSSNTAEKRLL